MSNDSMANGESPYHQKGWIERMHFCGVEKPLQLVWSLLVEKENVRSDEKNRFVNVAVNFAIVSFLVATVIVAYSYRAGNFLSSQPASQSLDLAGEFWGYVPTVQTGSAQNLRISGNSWYNLLLPQPDSSYLITLQELVLSKNMSMSPCDSELTTTVKLEGLPETSSTGNVSFQTDITHKVTLVAYREDGARRCSGGDYFEMDLHDWDNATYRSRLPVVDFGNGSYGLELMVPSRFAALFELVVYLSFSNWQGLLNIEPRPDFNGQALILKQEMQFFVGTPSNDDDKHSLSHKHTSSAIFTNLTQCTKSDFFRNSWHGRWTRTWFNKECYYPNEQLLWHCLPEEHYSCEEPWCFGPVGKLDSNGWTYSMHCGFKIFQSQEAWDCLSGRWIYSWGDSTSVDTLRNLLVLAMDQPLNPEEGFAKHGLPRTFEASFVNPRRVDQVLQVSQHWNGGPTTNDLLYGMKTLRLQDHQDHILSHFNGTRWPDVIIMNSLIHDAFAQDTEEQFSNISDLTIQWWVQLYLRIPSGRKPLLVWRTQVATQGRGFIGKAWGSRANVNRIEMFNLIFTEKLERVREKLKIPVVIVDAFDISFAWHYTDAYSDGPHYGLPPSGRWYFVDLMLGQAYLNAICS